MGSAAVCLDLCRKCARCAYVSYSAFLLDCSWFTTCPAGELPIRPPVSKGQAPYPPSGHCTRPLLTRFASLCSRAQANLTKEQLFNVVRQMRSKSLAKEFKGTVKEVLGTCNAVGCTVDGSKPMDLQKAIDEDEFECPES